MEKLNFDNGNKKIQVNEDGDYIVLPMGDNAFPKRLIDFTQKMKDVYNELIEKEKEFKRNGLDETNISDISEISDARAEIYTRIGTFFDEIFGNDSCRKVFGNLAPAQDIMISFLEQIKPLVERFADERRATIEKKYQPKRR